MNIFLSILIFRYILTLECRSDLEEYLSDLLDTGIPSNRRFITELLERWSKTPRKVAQNVPDDGVRKATWRDLTCNNQQQGSHRSLFKSLQNDVSL